MCGFVCSLLANFLGSLFVGALLAVGIYYFITRRLEIIQPREERIREEILVCSLLIDELREGRAFADGYLTGNRTEERLQMHAWDALKGSQAVRFLPIGCLEPMLKAYSDLYTLEYMFRKLEDAQLNDWAAGDSRADSGAARLGNMISKGVQDRLLRSQQNCGDAILGLTEERERLTKTLASDK